MFLNLSDTIVNFATSRSMSGVGIIRLSGSNSLNIAYLISKKKKIFANKINYSNFYDDNENIIDFGLILYFIKPKSFTGEDVIEFHVHGSILILDNLLSLILKLGARLSEPGEFTFRSYLNNKIDLLQAEAINDLITSNNKFCNKLILKSLFGDFSLNIKNIRNNIMDLRINLEAFLEFPDNVLFDENLIHAKLSKIISDFDLLFLNLYEKNLNKNIIRIIIIGDTNVGKSSLFNSLLKKNRSIISDTPGTTRDFIEDDFFLSNFNFKLVDTAGFNSNSECFIEKSGILKTIEQISNSEIILYLTDFGKNMTPLTDTFFKNLLIKKDNKIKLFFIKNKIDLYFIDEYIKYFDDYTEIGISVKDNLGLDFILNELNKSLIDFSNKKYIVNKKNYSLFLICKNHIDLIRDFNLNTIVFDVCLDNLKSCYDCFSEILGENSSDELLKEIFSKFCLGK